MNLIFSILCGGVGSRLWPKSREKLPKQLLKLTNEYTMLQNTVLRVNKMDEDFDIKIQVICNKEHAFLVEQQISELNIETKWIIITEPKGRDSAPAVCISSLIGKPEDYTFIIPCDHVFDDNEFINCCKQSIEYLDDSIVTFGIKPTRVETGYGYIKASNNITEKFVEKPNYELAQEFFNSGLYYWNAGVFAFKNKNMINCFSKYSKDILDNCQLTLENTDKTGKIINLSPTPFIVCKAISVDYAIMEKLCSDSNKSFRTITIPYNSVWNDIGSYLALYNELEKDSDNNVVIGDVIKINTSNCYIEGQDKLIATIGLNNVVIVESCDSILICDKDKTQDVKYVTDYLKKNNMEEYIIHKKAYRPWGWYINIQGDDHSGFKVKRIGVYPGKRLSLQSHNHRSEHWVIVKGNAKLQIGNDILFLTENQHVYIPKTVLHRIENVGNELLEFIETQIGNYLGEDDIVRYQDDFGRV
jgi:mannose-1-phosphate guanylyltransferase/mannose-6-phosphate isomerase